MLHTNLQSRIFTAPKVVAITVAAAVTAYLCTAVILPSVLEAFKTEDRLLAPLVDFFRHGIETHVQHAAAISALGAVFLVWSMCGTKASEIEGKIDRLSRPLHRKRHY